MRNVESTSREQRTERSTAVSDVEPLQRALHAGERGAKRARNSTIARVLSLADRVGIGDVLARALALLRTLLGALARVGLALGLCVVVGVDVGRVVVTTLVCQLET